MKLINLMPSDLIKKIEQNKSIFCKFGEIYKITINQKNIMSADFVELYARSYGNQYYSSDIKSWPISYEEFKKLEFREFYPEFFIFNQIDSTGNEAAFDTIVNQATLLPLKTETKEVDLVSTTNINITLRVESTERLYTSTQNIDGVETAINNKILLKNQTNKRHNGIWKVIKKNDNFTVGKNYTVNNYFLNGTQPYLVTSNFIATDFTADASNFQIIPQFAINTNYNAGDHVYFSLGDGKFAIYKCIISHAGKPFFRTNNFEFKCELNNYDWWERTDLFGKIDKPQYIYVLSGISQAGSSFLLNINWEKEYVYVGGHTASEIEFTSSTINPTQLPNILSNQNTLINLTNRAKDLFKSKWFPSKWLE